MQYCENTKHSEILFQEYCAFVLKETIGKLKNEQIQTHYIFPLKRIGKKSMCMWVCVRVWERARVREKEWKNPARTFNGVSIRTIYSFYLFERKKIEDLANK